MSEIKCSLDEKAIKAAETQMRLVLMGTGSLTLDQVNRHAPGLARTVVGAYLSEICAAGLDPQGGRS